MKGGSNIPGAASIYHRPSSPQRLSFLKRRLTIEGSEREEVKDSGTLTDALQIAGYARISVDDEQDRDNTSIENQKAIIADYVNQKFPGSMLTFYEDRDRSGYTFEQREGYQEMRGELMARKKEILIIKDFSRFSRRNSRGLVELEDLRDAGVRIISIGDGIDFPGEDDWLKIQFQFLINEMPVTDTSKKVRSVIRRRQADGKWICAAPYGYLVNKQQEFEICPAEAEVVRRIFELYNQGSGYKKIANTLTDMGIPTPRMSERERREAAGETYNRRVKRAWSIATVQTILDNDFYIGTLRQGKYTRAKINGKDVRRAREEQIVLEHHHPPIIDSRTFAVTRENRKKRSVYHYRGIKKYDHSYSGLMFCGDCGAPMFSVSRADLRPAYTCGSYHRRGRKGCTSHRVRTEKLDELLKIFIAKVKHSSAEMLGRFDADLAREKDFTDSAEAEARLSELLEGLKEELKATKRQRIRDIMKHPEQEDTLEETYDELESDLLRRMEGLAHHIELTQDRHRTATRIRRTAKTALGIFDDLLQKSKLERNDLELIVEKILVYEDHLDVRLKSDIDSLLRCGEEPRRVDESQTSAQRLLLVQRAKKHPDKVYDVHVVSDGDPLEIFTEKQGDIILKKYSPIGELAAYAGFFSDAISRTLGKSCVICDKDSVVAASGAGKREFAERPISKELLEAIEDRKKIQDKKLQVTEGKASCVQAMVPIICEGHTIGAVLSIDADGQHKGSAEDMKALEVAASFLGVQMEQ